MFSPLFRIDPRGDAQPGNAFVTLVKLIAVDGAAEEVKSALRNRSFPPGHVAGIVREEILRPRDRPDEFWFMTLWADRESFRAWRDGSDSREALEGRLPGLVPEGGEPQFLEFERVPGTRSCPA